MITKILNLKYLVFKRFFERVRTLLNVFKKRFHRYLYGKNKVRCVIKKIHNVNATDVLNIFKVQKPYTNVLLSLKNIIHAILVKTKKKIEDFAYYGTIKQHKNLRYLQQKIIAKKSLLVGLTCPNPLRR